VEMVGALVQMNVAVSGAGVEQLLDIVVRRALVEMATAAMASALTVANAAPSGDGAEHLLDTVIIECYCKKILYLNKQ
jgi:hypothetical protein